jgi:hypothetical protein
MLAVGETELAHRFVDGVEARTPLHAHGLASGRAQLAESDHRYADAVQLYSEAAERWHEFGDVPERACALLGQGRCLHALGDATAKVPLAQARDLFASIGYKPALAETQKLLAETVAKTA